MRPLIGISPDGDAPADAPTEAEYRVRMNYADAIRAAGGCPVILPWHLDDVDEMVDRCDGILVSGGTPGILSKDGRTVFERALIQAALDRCKPVLGICNGMQLLGQTLGAQFVESIAAAIPDAQDHIPLSVPTETAHGVTLTPGSRLQRLAGTDEARVNSLHRQAIAGTGRFTVAALASDGVIEAIEADGHPFALGTQWHPEYRLTALDAAILAAFVKACCPSCQGNRVKEW